MSIRYSISTILFISVFGACYGQISTDEAMKRMQAAHNAATQRAASRSADDISEIIQLKATIAAQIKQIDAFKNEIATMKDQIALLKKNAPPAASATNGSKIAKGMTKAQVEKLSQDYSSGLGAETRDTTNSDGTETVVWSMQTLGANNEIITIGKTTVTFKNGVVTDFTHTVGE